MAQKDEIIEAPAKSLKQRHSENCSAAIIAVVISLFALFISSWEGYHGVLKPFDLEIRIDPEIQIHHKTNFGLYLNAEFFNNSPNFGLIRRISLVLYKPTSKEDKYLITLNSFRILGDGVYIQSEEKLPLSFQPWQRTTKMMSFIYDADEQFPISGGTWICELLVWTDERTTPKYFQEIKFDVREDLLQVYLARRKVESTTLEPTNIVGYTPVKSQKLTHEDYQQLH